MKAKIRIEWEDNTGTLIESEACFKMEEIEGKTAKHGVITIWHVTKLEQTEMFDLCDTVEKAFYSTSEGEG